MFGHEAASAGYRHPKLTPESDPTSYLNYYKRATAYLSQGKQNAALDDFNAIIDLNPSFAQAYFQKAKVLAKEGDFDDAASAMKKFSKLKPGDTAGSKLSSDISSAKAALKAAEAAAKKKKWDECVEQATRAVHVAPNSKAVRELRVRCETERGDAQAVFADMTRLTSLSPSDTEAHVRLAQLAYYLIDGTSALNELKKCLHSDPDNKACKKLHRTWRAQGKALQQAHNFVNGGKPRKAINLLRGTADEPGLIPAFEAALDEAVKTGVIAPQFQAREKSAPRRELLSLGCRATVDAQDFGSRAGKAWCEALLQLEPDNESALVFEGERLLKAEDWEGAVRALQRAFEKNRNQAILQKLQKAERLLKVSKQKDYYKVLDVPRDADERTIKKAFRKKAKENHPDKKGGSEKDMQAINEAYEVLSDPELRARYDNGDDPNDPTGGQGGNPFGHHGGGGMPFFFQQGGGFPGGGFPGGGFPGGGFPGGGGGGGGGGQKFHFQWGH